MIESQGKIMTIKKNVSRSKFKEVREKITEALDRLDEESLRIALEDFIPLSINSIKDVQELENILENILSLKEDKIKWGPI